MRRTSVQRASRLRAIVASAARGQRRWTAGQTVGRCGAQVANWPRRAAPRARSRRQPFTVARAADRDAQGGRGGPPCRADRRPRARCEPTHSQRFHAARSHSIFALFSMQALRLDRRLEFVADSANVPGAGARGGRDLSSTPPWPNAMAHRPAVAAGSSPRLHCANEIARSRDLSSQHAWHRNLGPT